MAETKKPIEEVSVEDAQAMFANAAKALGGTGGRSEGFRRVSIPVSEPVRPEPLPTEEAKPVVEEIIDGERYVAPAVPPVRTVEPEKPQSKRKAWYLKKRQEEEEESLPISKEKLRERKAAREAAEDEDIRIAESHPSRLSTEDDYDEDRYDFGATTVIPNAVVFDYYDDYEDEYDDDYEPTNADLEEEVSFSALEEALNRHKQVYGDTRKGRRNRYHDYGFGMGITFDGPDYEDDEDY
ncbi:MAG: hypothetical protein E7567_00540 [Ruminococcaceae bacterium]|nr:hypothetical protein [Oscillospiraceae bacterium]